MKTIGFAWEIIAVGINTVGYSLDTVKFIFNTIGSAIEMIDFNLDMIGSNVQMIISGIEITVFRHVTINFRERSSLFHQCSGLFGQNPSRRYSIVYTPCDF